MNVQPVSYKQYDPRWALHPYNGKGEFGKTVKSSGCGPTSAAMLIATLAHINYTPDQACDWSVAHGYKWADSGTAFAYFVPQFAEFGISCFQLSWTNGYHHPEAKVHDDALKYLRDGYYLIGLANKGLWTGGGHFIVIYAADDQYIYVNDPNSSREDRAKVPIGTMCNEIAYYWVVDARRFNEEAQVMTNEEFRAKWQEEMSQYRAERQDNDTEYGDLSLAAREFCVKNGIFSGDAVENPNFMWEDFPTREQLAILFYNFAKFMGK